MSGTSDSHLHLEALHSDVKACFERVVPLLKSGAQEVGPWSKDPKGVDHEIAVLTMHQHSVENLELVMPIVAPMKAGKSTLINAIVGYELLPTRAHPMTTLPTRIVLDEQVPLDKPELSLPASLCAVYASLEKHLRATLTAGWQLPEGHQYLSPLAMAIADATLPELRPLATGVDAVHSTLARLNDQMRLAAFAAEDTDYLDMISELPTLRTGYVHDYATRGSRTGTLVIVDTPGPNENAMSVRLGRVLETQLAQSHVVLVVLDYTQMGGNAAADVQDRLGRHLEIIGKSRLYAVVNKVDQRKGQDDLSAEDTRASVRAALDLNEAESEGRIFEAIAHLGIIGSKVLNELGDTGTFSVDENGAAWALLRERSPFADAVDLAEELADLLPDKLRIFAQRAVAKSMVAGLVDAAIAELRAGAAPAVIDAGVRRFQAAIHDLFEALQLALSASDADPEEVRRELANLGTEMGHLKTLSDARPTKHELLARLQPAVADFNGRVRHHGFEAIRALDVEGAESEQAAPPSRLSSFRRWRRDPFASTVKHLRKKVWDGQPIQDSRSFNSESAATAFMKTMADAVVDEIRTVLEDARKDLGSMVDKLVNEVLANQETVTRPVIERAIERLSTTFDVTLTVPSSGSVVSADLEVDPGQPEAKHSYYGYTVTETERQPIRFTFKLLYRNVEVQRVRSGSSTSYLVVKSVVREQLVSKFETVLEEISVALDEYVESELLQALDDYYDGLFSFLERYRNVLEIQVSASQQDESVRAQRRAALTSLSDRLEVESARLAGYLQQLPPLTA